MVNTCAINHKLCLSKETLICIHQVSFLDYIELQSNTEKKNIHSFLIFFVFIYFSDSIYTHALSRRWFLNQQNQIFILSTITLIWKVECQRLISQLSENVYLCHGKTPMFSASLSLLVSVVFSLAMTPVSFFLLFFYITLFSTFFYFIYFFIYT